MRHDEYPHKCINAIRRVGRSRRVGGGGNANNVAITGGTISGLAAPLAIADGGTGQDIRGYEIGKKYAEAFEILRLEMGFGAQCSIL